MTSGFFPPIWQINLIIWVLAFWILLWWSYNFLIRTPDFHPMGIVLFDMPHVLKCTIKEVSRTPEKNDCNNAKCDMWSIGHLLIYISIGYIFPNHYLFILILSILCEAFEYIVGWRARWICDVLTNMIGYILGSLLAYRFYYDLSKLPYVQTPLSGIVGMITIIILLTVNQPHFMLHPMH